MFRRFFTRRRLVRLAALLLVLGLTAPHVWAWSKLRQARSALARHHPEEARRALDSCQRVWGWNDSPAVRLAACRAAWQDGDFEGAVRELRVRRALSQEELGSASGLHRNYVGAIERGEINPTFKILLKLCAGLCVQLSELFTLYEERRTEARPPRSASRRAP